MTFLKSHNPVARVLDFEPADGYLGVRDAGGTLRAEGMSFDNGRRFTLSAGHCRSGCERNFMDCHRIRLEGPTLSRPFVVASGEIVIDLEEEDRQHVKATP